MAISLAELAASLGADVLGNGDLMLVGAAEPQDAGPDDLAMAMSPAYGALLAKGRARAALIWADADFAALGLEGAIAIKRPRLAMSVVTQAFDVGLGLQPGIHPSAVIDPSAQIGSGAMIGPFVVIHAGVTIGASARISAHVSIGADSHIGADAVIHPGVRIAHGVRIGDRFVAQSGAVIGGDGFSFVTAEKSHVEAARQTPGGRDGAAVHSDQAWLRIHSIGGVEIGDDVEIGANSCVDRGTIRATKIGTGTKLDNLVQVAHNVVIGQHCLLCGQAAIAGSSVIGDNVVLGGRCGVGDNIKVGDQVVAGAGAMILSNVPSGRMVTGYPAVKMDQHIEMYKSLRRLPRFLASHRFKQD